MQPAEKVRLGWIELYEQVRDAGMVCRRCGVSRPTLRKWWRRYQAHGTAGLISRSRRPRIFAQRKVFEREEQLISALRTQRGSAANGCAMNCCACMACGCRPPLSIGRCSASNSTGFRSAACDAITAYAIAARFLATGCRWTSARSVPAAISTPRWMIAACVWRIADLCRKSVIRHTQANSINCRRSSEDR